MSVTLRRLLPSIPRLAMTLLIALTLAVPAVYLFGPHVHRWQTLRQLTADDPAARGRALHYVIQHAAEQPEVRARAIDSLLVEDPTKFVQLVAALEHAGVWSRQWIPDEAWLRWLAIVAESADAESGAFVAHRLADLPSLADDPRLIETLERLLASDKPATRYNAMITAASLLRHSKEDITYEAMIGARTTDPEPSIAHHAWLLLGHLDPVFGYGGNWQTAPPQVVPAMLWATVRTNPQQPTPAIAALTDPRASPAVRAAAAYALHLSDTDAAVGALLAAADVNPQAVTPENQLVIWRALLSLPRPNLQRKPYSRLERVVVGFAMDDGDDPLLEPLALASTCRMGIAGARRQTADAIAYDNLLKLAVVEGQRPPYMRWPLTGDKPPLLRVMTVAVDAGPHIGDLRPAFASPQSTLRDLAAVVAVEKFDAETLAGMAESLLQDYSDDAKMGGALLAGFANVQGDLLRDRLAVEDVWAVQQMMRLGLWMQGSPASAVDTATIDEGDQPAASPTAWPASLLMRHDMPRSTVLLAMMHRQRTDEALDHLLAPRGEPPIDLIELLATRRWWHVLRRYLPDDAPPFWLWADPQLQRFQIDVLRNWWLLEDARPPQQP